MSKVSMTLGQAALQLLVELGPMHYQQEAAPGNGRRGTFRTSADPWGPS